MATGLFVNRKGITSTLNIDLHDYNGLTGHAVWKTTLDGEVRYTEGHVNDSPWDIVDRAVHAYDEEE